MASSANQRFLQICSVLVPIIVVALCVYFWQRVSATQRGGGPISSHAFKLVKEDPTSGVKEYRLNSNGLTILLQEKHNSPVVTVMTMYKVGSRNEAVGYTGATHFLEHMMFKGTTAHDPGKGTGFDDVLKPMGGVSNASTSFDRTDYYEVVPSSGLSACLDLESDRMRNALLRNSDRTSEMTVVRNELERLENTAVNILDTQTFATAFREHPYHHPTIGWRSDVEGVPTERLRQFYNEFYYPNNATLLILGDFNTPDALNLVNRYFSGISPSRKPIPSVYTTEPPQEGERRFVVQRGEELPKIMVAYHIPAAADSDAYPLEVMASLLGDRKRQSSRLYKKLVDSGLATDTSATNLSMRDPGVFSVYASATSGTRLQALEKAIEEEIAGLARTPVTESELEKARKAVWKKLRLESGDPADYAQQLSDAHAVADWTWLAEMEKRVKLVSAAQVQQVAGKYFSERNRTVGYYLPVSEPSESAAVQPAGSVTAQAPPQRPQPGQTNEGSATKPTASQTNEDPAAPIGAQLQPEKVANQALPESGKHKVDVPPVAESSNKALIATRTQKRVLANGLTVFVLPVRGSGIVAVSAKIKGGSSGSPPDKSLLPGLTGEMLNKGSRHLSREELADTLESMACTLEPQVESFWTSVDSEVVTEDLDKFLAVLSEALREPAFPADELAKLKTQRASEIKDQMVETAELAANKFLGLVYKPGCVYYQRPYTEQIAELPRIEVADLVDFHKKRYVAANMTMALVGDLSYEQGFNLAAKYFGSWEKGSPADLSTNYCASQQAPRLVVSRLKDKTSVDIIMGRPADVCISSKDFCAAQLANAALGHDAISSRLAAVRQNYGLSYDIHSGFSDNAEPWSPWIIQLSVNPQNTAKALELVNGILTDYAAKGITPRELYLEKQRVAGEYLVYRMRSPRQLADAVSKYGTLGLGPEFMDRYPSMLNAVTLKEANEAISRYMQGKNLVTCLAGSVPDSIRNK